MLNVFPWDTLSSKRAILYIYSATPGRWTVSEQIIKDDVNSFSSISDICFLAVTVLQHVQGQHFEKLIERCPLPDFEYTHVSEQMYTLTNSLSSDSARQYIFYGKNCVYFWFQYSIEYSKFQSLLSSYIRWENNWWWGSPLYSTLC